MSFLIIIAMTDITYSKLLNRRNIYIYIYKGNGLIKTSARKTADNFSSYFIPTAFRIQNILLSHVVFYYFIQEPVLHSYR